MIFAWIAILDNFQGFAFVPEEKAEELEQPTEHKLIIYRVQRVSLAPVREIRPLKHFLDREDADKYFKEIQPDIEKLPFYRKLEIEEVRVY